MGTISFVGQTIVEADTATMPSHQAGDLIVVVAYRRSSTTLPTVPSRFANGLFHSRSAANRTSVAAFITATSSSEVVGTWTNAEFLIVGVWRDTDNNLGIGARTDSNNAGSTTATYATLASTTAAQSPTQRSTTASWAAAVILLNLNSTDGQAAPTGMTNRASLAGATNGEVALHDTNGNADWNANQTVTISASTAWVTIVFEIWDTGIPKSSGSSGRNIRINNPSLVRGFVL